MKKISKETEKAKKDAAHWDRVYNEANQKEATLERNLNRTKPLDALEERYETLKRANEEDQKVIDDENATSSDKQAAAACMEDRREEIERLEPQIQEREEALPLRERVKNIFKNYGWTLQAVVLAVGLVLGALALAGLKGLKAGHKSCRTGTQEYRPNVGLPPTRAHRLDCQLYIQSCGTGSILPA